MAADILGLVRRWAIDWLGSHDPSVLPEILNERYVLHIGGHDLIGRDTYRAATLDQLRRFPGLVLTVHDVMSNGARAAVRFTEHGTSLRHDRRAAAWRGIAMFRADDHRLVETYAEEDYLARRRQLSAGQPDPIEAPHVAPWDVMAQVGDEAGEESVRAWLAGGTLWASGTQLDDLAAGEREGQALLEVDRTEVDDLFSAGGRVAFHVTQHGRRHLDGATGVLRAAGLVEVLGGTVMAGHVVRDRLGLLRPPTVTSS